MFIIHSIILVLILDTQFDIFDIVLTFSCFYTTVVLMSVELLRTQCGTSKRVTSKDTMKGLPMANFKFPLPKFVCIYLVRNVV